MLGPVMSSIWRDGRKLRVVRDEVSTCASTTGWRPRFDLDQRLVDEFGRVPVQRGCALGERGERVDLRRARAAAR